MKERRRTFLSQVFDNPLQFVLSVGDIFLFNTTGSRPTTRVRPTLPRRVVPESRTRPTPPLGTSPRTLPSSVGMYPTTSDSSHFSDRSTPSSSSHRRDRRFSRVLSMWGCGPRVDIGGQYLVVQLFMVCKVIFLIN